MKLRSHVLIIAAATLLPIIAIVCLAVVLLFQKQRHIELDRLVDTARALSLAVDRDFETGLASLRALATNQDLRQGISGHFTTSPSACSRSTKARRRLFWSIHRDGKS
jgi:hypothetical protein